jgi:hypothetical protein
VANGLTLSEKRAIVASSAFEARALDTDAVPSGLGEASRPLRRGDGCVALAGGRVTPASPTHQAPVERGTPRTRLRPLGSSAERARRAERLLVLRAASPRRNSVNEACAYRKSNPAILVVQSAQDRPAENASNFLGAA